MTTAKDFESKIIEKYGEAGLCNYCIYEDNCSFGVVNYGNGPIFPPCADLESKDYLNIEYLKEVDSDEF